MGWVVILGIVGFGLYEYANSKAAAATEGVDPLTGELLGAGPEICCHRCDGPTPECIGGIVSCDITSDPATWPTGDRIWDVCQAIARAEGAHVGGSVPDRYNNPGDLSKGDEHGQPVVGYVKLTDKETLIQFVTKIDGWTALYSKISRIVLGKSKAYSVSMTWRDMATKYAGNSANWLGNVTAALGVSPDDTLGSYFA